MSGTYGEVRGKSKGETYQRYLELVNSVQEIFQEFPDSQYKKRCKELMMQDPQSGEWVLSYHLHT